MAPFGCIFAICKIFCAVQGGGHGPSGPMVNTPLLGFIIQYAHNKLWRCLDRDNRSYRTVVGLERLECYPINNPDTAINSVCNMSCPADDDRLASLVPRLSVWTQSIKVAIYEVRGPPFTPLKIGLVRSKFNTLKRESYYGPSNHRTARPII